MSRQLDEHRVDGHWPALLGSAASSTNRCMTLPGARATHVPYAKVLSGQSQSFTGTRPPSTWYVVAAAHPPRRMTDKRATRDSATVSAGLVDAVRAHLVQQPAERFRGGQRPADVSQVMKVQSGDASALGGGAPDRPEVGPPQSCSLRADEDEALLPGAANRSRCQRSSGTSSAGKATVRRPAFDFGVSGIRPPRSSSGVVVSMMRTTHATRSTFSRRSPTSSPQLRLPKVASSTSAR